jgi:hypothetical protein
MKDNLKNNLPKIEEGEYIKELVNSQKYLVSRMIEDEISSMVEKGSLKNENNMTTLAQVWDYLEDTRKDKND